MSKIGQKLINDEPEFDFRGRNLNVCNARYEQYLAMVEADNAMQEELERPLVATSVSILNEAANCIGNRASERDTDAERSMAATVRAFNGMFGTELTEEQGWHFMTLLKMSRAKGGEYRRDDYVDGAAYFALAGECREND